MSSGKNGRTPLIAANWKMNKTIAETESFIGDFLPRLKTLSGIEVVLCPPFTALQAARKKLEGSTVALGAQDMSPHKAGAYTAEISGSMIKELGCRFVIVGHSERRQYHGETDTLVNKKIFAAFAHGLLPIVCVGETLQEREADQTKSVIGRQLQGAFQGVPSAEMQQLVIAYEPVWAIGTGKTASPEQAQDVHCFIRDYLKDQYGSLTSHAVRVLYGGSVKPDNMKALMDCEDIDGGLVGGASLDSASFADIANYKKGS